MKKITLLVKYVIFSILATFLNLFTQRIILNIKDDQIFFIIAISFGTLIGLIVKYILDKRWIFYDKSSGIKTHRNQFGLYSMMGIGTTSIFWGTETLFWLTWKINSMRELGAIIGLSMGYIIKYRLDKRYVFNKLSFKD